MSSEQPSLTPEPEPVATPTEPPPPYQPDLSLITELEKGLSADSPGVETR